MCHAIEWHVHPVVWISIVFAVYDHDPLIIASSKHPFDCCATRLKTTRPHCLLLWAASHSEYLRIHQSTFANLPEFEPNGLADCTVYRTSSRGGMEVKLLLLLEDTRTYSFIKGGITHKSELWVGLTPKFQYASSPRAKLCHAYKCRNAQF